MCNVVCCHLFREQNSPNYLYTQLWLSDRGVAPSQTQNHLHHIHWCKKRQRRRRREKTKTHDTPDRPGAHRLPSIPCFFSPLFFSLCMSVALSLRCSFPLSYPGPYPFLLFSLAPFVTYFNHLHSSQLCVHGSTRITPRVRTVRNLINNLISSLFSEE